ncbi:unnamed protein product [Brassica oleracea]
MVFHDDEGMKRGDEINQTRRPPWKTVQPRDGVTADKDTEVEEPEAYEPNQRMSNRRRKPNPKHGGILQTDVVGSGVKYARRRIQCAERRQASRYTPTSMSVHRERVKGPNPLAPPALHRGIRQNGSLRGYQREFEKLKNKVTRWTQKALIGTYIGGLKDSISDSIRMFQPRTLKAMIELARMRDDQLQRARRYTNTPQWNVRTNNANPTPPEPGSATPKRLSWDEMKRKRSLGLCFSCDERYTPDHRCRKSQLLLIEGIEEEDDEIEIPPDTEEAEITLQSLTGWGSHKTNRTYTETQRRTLITLIDSGASHKFINDKTAALLNLQLTPTKPFHVRVADGFPLQCNAVYRKVQTRVNGVNFPIDFFPIPLKGLDMVLGIQWLIQVGPTLCD